MFFRVLIVLPCQASDLATQLLISKLYSPAGNSHHQNHPAPPRKNEPLHTAGIGNSYAIASGLVLAAALSDILENAVYPGLTFLVPLSENSLLCSSSRSESVSKSLVNISTQSPLSL